MLRDSRSTDHDLKLAALSLQYLHAGECSGTNFYLGFDRNDYPGDANLAALRRTFSYTGYWLNDPPGEKTNSWTGHRAAVESAGFGFLVLFNGRLYAELKSVSNATRLGQSDAKQAVSTARREGFLSQTVIFLDQEQGADVARAESLHLCVGGWRYRCGIPRRRLLFRNSEQRRRKRDHGRRYSPKRGYTKNCVLGD